MSWTFFKKYYAPSNASLVVAGDIDPVATRKLVEKWFGDIKPGAAVEPMTPPRRRADRRDEDEPSPTKCSCRASTSRG